MERPNLAVLMRPPGPLESQDFHTRFIVFQNVVRRWLETLPEGENKRTVKSLLVLHHHSNISTRNFIQSIEACTSFIETGHVCRIEFGGLRCCPRHGLHQVFHIDIIKGGITPMDLSSEE